MKYVISVWVVCAFLSASPGAVAWQSAQSSNSSSTGVGATGQTSPAASAAVPRLIKFSGVLRDLAGKPLAGPVDVTFSLYSEDAGGSALWFETQTVQADSRGNYTVLLGATSPDGVPMELFASGEARWLGVQVANLQEQPRVLLVSVPYAMKAGDADTLGGKPLSQFVLKNATAPTGSTPAGAGAVAGVAAPLPSLIASDSATPQATGSTPVTTAGGTLGFLPIWDSPSDITDSALFQDSNTGFIGLGTTTPAAPLHVQSGTYTSNLMIVDNGQTSPLPAFPNNFSPSLSIRASQTGGSRPFWFGYDNNGSWAGFVGIGACAGDYSTICLDQGSGTSVNTVFKASGNSLTIGGGAGTSGNFSTISLAPVSGSVGIGTTSPTATLEVNGTAKFDQPVTFAAGQTFPGATFTGSAAVQGDVSATGQLISTVSTGTAPIQVASTTQVPNLNASLLGGLGPNAFALVGAPNNFIGNQSVAGNLFVGSGAPLNLPLEIRTGSSEALTVAPSGRVGIGTSSPSFGLDVNSAVFAVGPNVPSPGSGGTMRLRDDTGTLRWLFGIPGSAGSTDFFMYNNVSGAAPVYIKAGAPSYRLYLDSTGNVGIGTTTPTATLEVNGSAKFDGTVNFAGTQTFTGTISATGQIVSTVSTGTAPLSVTSTTQVANLNASLLGGMPASAFATVGANFFTGTQTIAGGNLALPGTAGSGVGVLSIGGAPFAHSYGSTSNTFLGRSAGNFSMTGGNNTATGSLALLSNGSGGSNTATGGSALVSNTIGSSNTATGYAALYSNNAGANNTASGSSALFNNTDAGGNTAMGYGALLNNCMGTASGCTAGSNTAVGYNAGVTSNTSNANTAGAGNTFLGASSGPASSTQLNNSTAVGANAVVGASNALVLGSISGLNGAAASVKVGIGTPTPAAALHVANGDVYASQAGTGIIVKSPDGTKCARIGIDNSGTIVVSTLTCP